MLQISLVFEQFPTFLGPNCRPRVGFCIPLQSLDSLQSQDRQRAESLLYCEICIRCLAVLSVIGFRTGCSVKIRFLWVN